jgi:hypothetical protein
VFLLYVIAPLSIKTPAETLITWAFVVEVKMLPFSAIGFQSQAFSSILLRLLIIIFIFHGLCHALAITVPRTDLDEENITITLEF